MTKLINVLAISALAVPLGAAAQGDAAAGAEHSEHEQHAAQSDGAGEQSPAAMHEHMREMREQMASIHATDDPAERERLMHEHMQSMQQHMQMMGSMRAESRPTSAGRCAEGDAACGMEELRADNGMMRERMGGLQARLESIEQLLQQMLEHQRADEEGATRRDRRR